MVASSSWRASSPVHAVFIPTYRSNIVCEHADLWRLVEGELGAAEIRGLLRDLGGSGVRSVLFDGGEPLMRPDIGELISSCRENGIKAALRTNGVLVREMLSELTGLSGLQVWLSWADAHPFDNELYEKALGALEDARALGIDASARVLLTRSNISAMPAMLADISSMGVQARFLRLFPSGVSTDNSRLSSEMPGTDESESAASLIEEYRARGAPVFCEPGDIACREGGAGQAARFVISPSGRLAPCACLLGSRVGPDCTRLGFKAAFEVALGIFLSCPCLRGLGRASNQ